MAGESKALGWGWGTGVRGDKPAGGTSRLKASSGFEVRGPFWKDGKVLMASH